MMTFHQVRSWCVGVVLATAIVSVTTTVASADLTDFSDYTLFAEEWIIAEDDLTAHGSVGSNTTDADGGFLILGHRATVFGRVASRGPVTIGDDPAITGPVSEDLGSLIDPLDLPVPHDTHPGGGDVDETDLLAPDDLLHDGDYGSLLLGDDSSLKLESGDYHFSGSFTANDGLTLTLDLSGGPINIFVDGDVFIGAGLSTSLIGGDASQVSAQTNTSWTLGDGGNWFGSISAASGSLFIGDNNTINGRLYGKQVTLGNNVTIVPAPGALALGMIGLGMVAWVRKRRTAS